MKIVRTGAVFEDSSLVLMCRIMDTDNALPPASAVGSILITVFDLADPANKIDEITLTAPYTGNWFDALQTSSIWVVDRLGFNFRYITKPWHLPDGDRTIRFDARFVFPVVGLDAADWPACHQSWDVPTLDLKRS